MPKSTGIKMPTRLRDLLTKIDRIELDSTHPRQAFPDTGIQLFDKSGTPIQLPQDIEPLVASLVQWLLNQPTNRLKKTECDDLRRRLNAYGMELHHGKLKSTGGGTFNRWFITRKGPLLENTIDPDPPFPGGYTRAKNPWSWILCWNGNPKMFWRLKRIAEFLEEVEKCNPFETTALKAENETKGKLQK